MSQIGKTVRRFFAVDPPAIRRLGPEDRRLIAEIRDQHLTYLSPAKLACIRHACRAVDEARLPGDLIEAGCALGGSAILISKIKDRDRQFRVYDVFGMIPQPTVEDGDDVRQRYATIVAGQSAGIGGDTYYGYEDGLYEKVRMNLRRFDIDEAADHVSLIQGLVQDTLHVDGPIALAHIDVDWYEPVKTCLERIEPNLVVGGSIVLDDYNDWSGCRQATDEYFAGRWDLYGFDDSAGSLKLTRLKA